MIELKQIKKSFSKNEVLKNVSINISEPGLTAILGPNASGKTTLIKCILGMVIPNEGSVLFEGKDIKGKHEYRNKINYIPQIASFPENLRVRELFKLIKNLRTTPANNENLLNLFDLNETMDSRLGILSGGTKQKINITRALMYDSPVWILDEPTAGLDPLSQQRLKQLIIQAKSEGKIILLTTHIMSLVDELADNVVYLLDGQIHFLGSKETLLANQKATSVESALASIMLNDSNSDTDQVPSLKSTAK